MERGGDGKRPSRLKKSFTYHAWQRMRTVCKALAETREEVARLRGDIESRVGNTERISLRHGEVEAARTRVSVLSAHLETSRKSVLSAKGRVTKARIHHQQTLLNIASFEEEIGVVREELEERRSVYITARESLLRSIAQLSSRRRQLVEELEGIYPVTSAQNNGAVGKEVQRRGETCECSPILCIADSHVPPAESYAGHNEIELSVGLGHVAQVLCVLCRLLDLNLRFPITLRGSHSLVANLTSAGFKEAERVVPLWSRGQEAESFGYAVYLLNRDIGQVRGDLGLSSPDLRRTLANLQGLYRHIRATRTGPSSSSPRVLLSASSSRVPSAVSDLPEDQLSVASKTAGSSSSSRSSKDAASTSGTEGTEGKLAWPHPDLLPSLPLTT